MRPLEEYPTLRKGQELIRQEEAAAWDARIARISHVWHHTMHQFALRLIKWGYTLERYALRPRRAAF